MTALPILIYPNAALRKIAAPVTDITPEVIRLLHDMAETMYASPVAAIGLAAPQIGVSKRLVVIDATPRDENAGRDPLFLVNPEIISASDTKTILNEGCLSLPEMHIDVERSEHVTVRYQDIAGETCELDADELLAKCLQHEIDHLNGRLIFDYLSPLKRDIALRKYQKTLKNAE